MRKHHPTLPDWRDQLHIAYLLVCCGLIVLFGSFVATLTILTATDLLGL